MIIGLKQADIGKVQHTWKRGQPQIKTKQYINNNKKKRTLAWNKRKSIPKHKGTKEKHTINMKTRFKMAMNTCSSIITLNVNGLNTSIKRHRVADWIKKKEPTIAYIILPPRDSS